MNYSFDYDNTLIKYKYIRDSNGEILDVVYDLPHYENIKTLLALANEGHTIYIITSRVKPEPITFRYEWDISPSPEEFIKDMDLPVSKIIYTNGEKKIEKLILHQIKKHWDDDENECEEIFRYNTLSYPETTGHQIEYVLVAKEDGITERLREKFIRLTKNEN